MIFKGGCFEAPDILWAAWKMNLLHAKFICHHEKKGPLIYCYDPFTNQAPIPWQLKQSYTIESEHTWTLLVRRYQDSKKICENLDFDKSKDLGGHIIRAGVLSSQIKSSSGTNLESVIGPNGIIARYMFRALNSTVNISDAQSTQQLFVMSVHGVTDISLNTQFIHNYSNVPMTYPHRQFEVASITQHRGYLSQIEKLRRVIDRSSRYAVVIVCFITFFFFKFFLRQSVTSAILTIVRLICNAAVPNPPSNLATRIYLSGLFIFLTTLQGVYQGKLASLLTKPEALPNVETFEDLENFKYTIYGNEQLTFFFQKLEL